VVVALSLFREAVQTEQRVGFKAKKILSDFFAGGLGNSPTSSNSEGMRNE